MKRMATALLVLVAAALLCLAAVWHWQDRLIYHPQPARVDQLVGGALRPWPSAQDFRGLVAEPGPGGAARGTVVVFHGNGGHVGHRAYYAQVLGPLGWRVVLAEHPGYGPRGGVLGEASLVPDAQATLALARERFGGPLLVIGESLGAAVAAGAVVGQRERVDGLLLLTPWDRLVHVAAHHYPWLPVRWLLRDDYDSAARLADFDRPVVVVVAARDRVVPARFGQALHDALRGPRRLLVLAGSGHNDWPGHVDAAWWRAALAAAQGRAP